MLTIIIEEIILLIFVIIELVFIIVLITELIERFLLVSSYRLSKITFHVTKPFLFRVILVNVEHFFKFFHDFFLRIGKLVLRSKKTDRKCTTTTEFDMRFIKVGTTSTPTAVKQKLIIFQSHLSTIESACHPLCVLAVTTSTKSVCMYLIYIYQTELTLQRSTFTPFLFFFTLPFSSFTNII